MSVLRRTPLGQSFNKDISMYTLKHSVCLTSSNIYILQLNPILFRVEI